MRTETDWLDKYIKEQQQQREALDKASKPYTSAELQEIAEYNSWD